MKKILFVILVLAAGLWSCSSDNDGKGSDLGYVDVTIGSESGKLKSHVQPGGQTIWSMDDKVMMIDTDGSLQEFAYIEETSKSSGKFKGMLKSGQGKQVYKTFHAPERSRTTLQGNILVVERGAIDLDAKEESYNSSIFGSYCPMVAIPIEFDANNSDDIKSYQFYHLTTMIMGKLSLRTVDTEIRSKVFDNVRFEVFALNDKKPFYTTIKLDMDMLTTTSGLKDLSSYIVNKTDESVKIDHMITTMNFKDREDFTVDDLLTEYSDMGGFPIPIIALPTDDNFNYKASMSFYKGEDLVLKFEGEGEGTAKGLAPAGLNILNFDRHKLVFGGVN